VTHPHTLAAAIHVAPAAPAHGSSLLPVAVAAGILVLAALLGALLAARR
jgi:hypothetical protein